VQRTLLPLLGVEALRLEIVSEICGLTTRTLQRKPAESGASFRSVLDKLRFAHAVQRLDDDRAKLIDIAFELGFSDPAHFTRAFRRWTGVSPREFRRRRWRAWASTKTGLP
jgi:AraC-like DNA-binding protein